MAHQPVSILKLLFLIALTIVIMAAIPLLVIGKTLSIYVMGTAFILASVIIGYMQKFRHRDADSFTKAAFKAIVNGSLLELFLCVSVKYLGLH